MGPALFMTCTQVDAHSQKKHIPADDFTLLNWLTISGGSKRSNVPTKQAKHDLKYLNNWLCKFSLRKETHLTQYIRLQSNTQCSQPSSNSLRRQTKISSSKKKEGKSNIKKSKLEKPDRGNWNREHLSWQLAYTCSCSCQWERQLHKKKSIWQQCKHMSLVIRARSSKTYS